eukprot:TRINITY_DN13918_c0_g1_i3.p3 TRINITY_DN13918_c0_g1~~TRINITY_DN13918_c0_g1_i3.p3  ORF type:complete len:130 (+),score=26.23 TRINITY_DN13918_c0_g1_i3:645-1034(+)
MNLGITDMTIKGYNNIGGIAGFTKGKYSFKLIENCFVQAKITGNENIGGLVGYNDSGIYYSYSVTWLEGKDQEKMGGIVGYNDGRIVKSYYNSNLFPNSKVCLLYTSDAADDTPCVDLGGRRIIKKKKK